ncbi:MAG: hydroxyacylglutathione hydrolase [Betaproteobacteria bacterium HGW-Betaproteobacteria-11]|nr:MAG: hydroxyacylglutathione hydrolase [Betaproteobacteria bacterium HGW-Betaproteobacteria-11]
MEITALPAFTDNYIWLLRDHGCVAVVDPGDAAPVLAHLEASGERLAAILLTHHHPDHIGGVAALLARHVVPVFAPAINRIPGTTHPLRGGEHIALPELGPGLGLDVIAVPGHTLGHLAYYGSTLTDAGAVFCGDTLFAGGCGRLFEGTPAQMQASLARLAVLPAPTFVYCGHEYTEANLRFARAVEPDNAALAARSEEVAQRRKLAQPTVPSRLAEELATNPFLRWDAPAVQAAAAAQLGHAPLDAVATFAAIRAWKDRF